MTQDNGTGALNQTADINALVDKKISEDADFQSSLTSLTQEEADAKIAEKKAELTKQEYSSLAEQAKKDKELAENYKIRAEKAEKAGKNTPPAEQISISDLHALRNVHDDDIAEVQEYAKFKNISIKDALNSSVIKTLIAEKEEQRKTAAATNTNSNRPRPQTASVDEVLSEASEGKLPDDPTKLAEAREAKRKTKKK